jgi:hypothetical protein
MLLLLILVFITLFLAAAGLSYLLGFRLGGDHGRSELARVRLEAAESERQLHNLTRQAFWAMAKHVEERKTDDHPGGES